MKTYNDFIKEYLFKVPSDIVYTSKGRFLLEDMVEERDEKYRKYNAMGMIFDWYMNGQYEARKCLPRSKYRKLCKRVEMRFKSLERKYK